MPFLCRLFGKSYQAYYKHHNSVEKQLATEMMVLRFIKEMRLKDPGIGGEKLHYLYKQRFGENYEYTVGRDKMESIISKYGLNVRKTRKRPRTTDSGHGLPTYPNLVKNVIPERRTQIWVSDITYIPVWRYPGEDERNFCYLSLITDCYTKEIVGWCVAHTLEAKHSIEALYMALERLCGEEPFHLIHHSDRGVQYASAEYVNILKQADIEISMTECGDPKDNAVAERVNGIIKNELLKDFAFYSIEEVRKAVAKAVDFYNNERPHMSLNNMTPSQAAKCTGRLQKKWTSYRERYLDSLVIQPGATVFAS